MSSGLNRHSRIICGSRIIKAQTNGEKEIVALTKQDIVFGRLVAWKVASNPNTPTIAPNITTAKLMGIIQYPMTPFPPIFCTNNNIPVSAGDIHQQRLNSLFMVLL
jgi:hypothetical protein